ncbi:MAG: 50S ribosomal protein L17 [Prevotella sp.]|jgi:large subunit ribosomal protein L17|nr:50S ribosomal protein L17 [Prevotella sp.]MCH4181848.1 50S ribosomal protein L17 [Prevotella sp.]MCH4212070.1 50S ribosomal protein L17 [Prevotella sp.]MCH4241365.1 50S ribosomal protein L17 [Prevotella sp.]MCI1742010.1 50S ribosomal protein L17 [Prevotella sp.]
MRHNKKFNHLSRTASHRASLLANLSISLIMHKRITTTVAKAKALKKYVEPLITRSKNDTTTSRRVVFRYLQDKEAIKELFGTVAAKIGNRPGGYTRVIKLGSRLGDGAEMAFIELVDFDDRMAKTAKTAAKHTRRGGRKKATEATAPEAEAVETTEKEVLPKSDAAVTKETPAKAKAKVAEVKEPKAPKSKKETPKAE